MKAVLMSIRPEWCDLIASGKKTVEIRKTKPNLETPFRCYIYCTKGDSDFSEGDRFCLYAPPHDTPVNANQAVIGEFVCDKIFDICIEMSNPNDLPGCPFPHTGLTDKDILKYLGNGKTGYGWHISQLKLYDKPRWLGTFYTVDKQAVKQCEHRERACTNPDLTNGAFLPGGYVCMKDEIDWCSARKRKRIIRPPQSWCYVKELTDNA